MKSISLTLIFLIIIGIAPLSGETHPEKPLTYEAFGDLLAKAMDIELPEGTELLRDEEYYEVIANIFAERGIDDFVENARSSVVTRSGMADVLYIVSGGTEELSSDEKIDYLIDNGYMPQAYLDSAVTFVEGDVLILKKDAKKWQPATPGDSLSEGDNVKTLATSRVKLQFASGGRVILKEDTSLDIVTLDSSDPEKATGTELYLTKGEIKASIKRLEQGSTFEIKTPIAVCGIRGTVFYVKVDKKTNTWLFVGSGGVNFLSFISNLFQNVGKNQGSFANTKGNIQIPRRLSLEEIKKWLAGYENIFNSVPITFGDGIGILNNPALARALAEAYSRPPRTIFFNSPPGATLEETASGS